MKDIFAVSSESELRHYQTIAGHIREKLNTYLESIIKEYAVTDLPRAILWTCEENATKLISDIPVPAYTNDYRTIFCPDLEVWQKIYLKQLDILPDEDAKRYYMTRLTEDNMLQILGHEFVHHSDLFLEGTYEKGIWFEEGMCEYISRKYFLTETEFAEEAWINERLVDLYQQKFGKRSLEAFGADTYKDGYADIFHGYWSSFLAVKDIIDRFGGNVMEVFREYQRWFDSNSDLSLSEWFGIKTRTS